MSRRLNNLQSLKHYRIQMTVLMVGFTIGRSRLCSFTHNDAYGGLSLFPVAFAPSSG